VLAPVIIRPAAPKNLNSLTGSFLNYYRDDYSMIYALTGTSLTIEIDAQHLMTDWSQLLSLFKKILFQSHKTSGFMFFNPLQVTDDDVIVKDFLGTNKLLIDLNRCKLVKTENGKRKVVKLINLMDWDDDEPYYFFNIDYPHLKRDELNALVEWSEKEDLKLKMCI